MEKYFTLVKNFETEEHHVFECKRDYNNNFFLTKKGEYIRSSDVPLCSNGDVDIDTILKGNNHIIKRDKGHYFVNENNVFYSPKIVVKWVSGDNKHRIVDKDFCLNCVGTNEFFN